MIFIAVDLNLASLKNKIRQDIFKIFSNINEPIKNVEFVNPYNIIPPISKVS